MPSPYLIRSFTENHFYHIFNRGIGKRKIFLDEQDYKMFKYYLFIYLDSPQVVLKKYPQLPLRLLARNLSEKIDLVAYCLMPNHFHLLLNQKSQDAIPRLMKQISNAYTRYFNTKYERRGYLMEGRYKATSPKTDEIVLHITRYIHLNPLIGNLVSDLKAYFWSSYPYYLGIASDSICKKEAVLEQFSSIKDYEKFVEGQIEYAKELNKIKHLTIDQD